MNSTRMEFPIVDRLDDSFFGSLARIQDSSQRHGIAIVMQNLCMMNAISDCEGTIANHAKEAIIYFLQGNEEARKLLRPFMADAFLTLIDRPGA